MKYPKGRIVLFLIRMPVRFKVIFGLIVLDPNLDLFKVKKKTKSATEELSTPAKSSDMPPPGKTSTARTPAKPPASPAVPPSPGPSSESVKIHVIDRDLGCIITRTHPSACIMS